MRRDIEEAEPAQGAGLFLFWGALSALLTCPQVRLPARRGATMARPRAISGAVPRKGTHQTPEAGDPVAPQSQADPHQRGVANHASTKRSVKTAPPARRFATRMSPPI